MLFRREAIIALVAVFVPRFNLRNIIPWSSLQQIQLLNDPVGLIPLWPYMPHFMGPWYRNWPGPIAQLVRAVCSDPSLPPLERTKTTNPSPVVLIQYHIVLGDAKVESSSLPGTNFFSSFPSLFFFPVLFFFCKSFAGPIYLAVLPSLPSTGGRLRDLLTPLFVTSVSWSGSLSPFPPQS